MNDDNELVKILKIDVSDAEGSIERIKEAITKLEGEIQQLTSSIDTMTGALSYVEAPEVDMSAFNATLTESTELARQLKIALDEIESPDVNVTSLLEGLNLAQERIDAISRAINPLQGQIVLEAPEMPEIKVPVTVTDFEIPEVDVPTIKVPVEVEEFDVPKFEIDPISVPVTFDAEDVKIPDIEPIEIPVEVESVEVPDIPPVSVPITFDVADVEIPKPEDIVIPVNVEVSDFEVPDPEPIDVPVTFDVEQLDVPTPDPITVDVDFNVEDLQIPQPEPLTVEVNAEVPELDIPKIEPITIEVNTDEAVRAIEGLTDKVITLRAEIEKISFPDVELPQLDSIQTPDIDIQGLVDSITTGFQEINGFFSDFIEGFTEGIEEGIEQLQNFENEFDTLDETIQELQEPNITFNSMREAKTYADELRASLVTLDKDSDEYANTAVHLRDVQQRINDAMAVGKSTYDGAADSINGMRKNLRDLVHQYDALSKADRESEFGKQLKADIQQVTGEVKALEAETGRFQRNVGNYAGDISKALAGIGISAGGAISPVKGLKAALDLMKGHPIIAVIALLVAGLNELREAFNRNSEATLALKNTFAPLQAEIIQVQQAFDKLAAFLGNVLNTRMQETGKETDELTKKSNVLMKVWQGLLKVAEVLYGWPAKLLGITDEKTEELTGKLREINNLEYELYQEQTEWIKENAKLDKQAAEESAKTRKKDELSAQQRLQALQNENDIRKQQFAKEREFAQKEFEIAQKRASLLNNNKEAVRQLAEAEAKLIDIDKRMAQADEQYSRQKSMITNQIVSEANAAHKALIDAHKNRLNTEIGLEKDGSRQQYLLQTELLNLEYQEAVKSAKDNIKNRDELYKTLETLHKKYLSDLAKLDQDYADKAVERNNDVIRKHQTQFKQGTVDYISDELTILYNEYAAMYQQIGETDEAYAKRRAEKEREISDTEISLATEVQRVRLTEQKNTIFKLERNSEDYLKAEKKILEQELADIIENGAEAYKSEADYQNAILKKRQEIADKSKELLQLDYEKQEIEYEIKIIGTSDNGWDRLIAERELIKFQLDNIQRSEFDSEEKYLLEKLRLEKEYTDKSKEIIESQIDTYQTLAESIGDIFGTLADYYEEELNRKIEAGEISEKESEKEFERIKRLQEAQVVIDTLSGAISAFMAWQRFQPYGWAVGLAQAAAVTAAGVAQYEKIKNTTLKASTAPTKITAQATPNIQNYSNVYQVQETGLSEIANLNETVTNGFSNLEAQMINRRFYVVESDISNAQAKANQRRTEVTF